MKRPLAVFGFAFAVSLFVLCLADNVYLCVFFGAAALVSFAVLFVLQYMRRFNLLAFMTAAMAVFAAGSILMLYEAYFYQPALSLVGERKTLTATIIDYPVRSEDRYHVTARIDNSPRQTKVRLSLAAFSTYDEEIEEVISALEPDDKVQFTGTVYTLGGANKSVARSFKSKGIYLGAYPLSKVNLQKAEKHSFSFYIKRERKKTINQLLYSFDSECAGLMISVLLGDKTYLSDEIYQSFCQSGVAHIMAVSGLHLSVWVLFVLSVLEKLRLDRRRAAVFLMLFVVLVMAFASFSGSVMRAGIMMLIYLFGFVIKKTPDALNSLGMAAAVILFANPFLCLNTGFQLSMLSTFAIIIFASPLSEYLLSHLRIKDTTAIGRILGSVINSVSISICVCVFTFPVLISTFGSFNLLVVIANLLFLPAAMPMIVFSGLYVMFYFVPLLSEIFKLFSLVISKYLILCAKAISSFSFSSINIPDSAVPFLIVASVLGIAVILMFKFRRSIYLKRAAYLTVTVLVAFSVFTVAYFRYMTVTVKAYDVGNGLCVTVSHGKNTALISAQCDNYHSDFVLRAVQSSGNKLSLAVIQDVQKLNSGLLSALSPQKIICPQSEEYLPLILRSACINGETAARMDDVKVEIFGEAVIVDVWGKKITIANNGSYKADIVISDDIQTIQNSSAETAIFSGERVQSGFISTADTQGVSVVINRNGKFILSGDNSWLYLMKTN